MTGPESRAGEEFRSALSRVFVTDLGAMRARERRLPDVAYARDAEDPGVSADELLAFAGSGRRHAWPEERRSLVWCQLVCRLFAADAVDGHALSLADCERLATAAFDELFGPVREGGAGVHVAPCCERPS